MNINDLTIGQAKELASMLGGKCSKSSMLDSLVGKYVICRSQNEGINAGYVQELDETGVILKECRRIWYHKPKDTNQSWYEGVANSGLSDDSKISAPVESKAIIEDYSLTVCTSEAEESIKSRASHAQN